MHTDELNTADDKGILGFKMLRMRTVNIQESL